MKALLVWIYWNKQSSKDVIINLKIILRFNHKICFLTGKSVLGTSSNKFCKFLSNVSSFVGNPHIG